MVLAALSITISDENRKSVNKSDKVQRRGKMPSVMHSVTSSIMPEQCLQQATELIFKYLIAD